LYLTQAAAEDGQNGTGFCFEDVSSRAKILDRFMKELSKNAGSEKRRKLGF
jgi:hypothetical protein